MSSLSVRTKNPFNVRYNAKNNWQGQIGQINGFCVFIDHIYGLRCGIILLRNYIINGFDCVDEIISRYAPKSENDTLDYIHFVRSEFYAHGFAPDVIKLGSPSFRLLCQLIARFESGYTLSLNEYNYVIDRFKIFETKI